MFLRNGGRHFDRLGDIKRGVAISNPEEEGEDFRSCMLRRLCCLNLEQSDWAMDYKNHFKQY